jgi:hypothetical protein
MIDLDQTSAVFHAVLERHPESMHMAAYIKDRAYCHKAMGGDGRAAKRLFRALVVGGGQGVITKWDESQKLKAPQLV